MWLAKSVLTSAIATRRTGGASVPEDCLRRAVGVCMGASGHAGANDGNHNGISHDDHPLRCHLNPLRINHLFFASSASDAESEYLMRSAELEDPQAAQEGNRPALRAASSSTPAATSSPSMRPSETSSCSILTSMSGSTTCKAESQVDQ